MSDRFGTDVATRKETIEGTWTIDGKTYDLITEDTTKGTLDLIGEYLELAATVENAEDESDIPEGLGEDLDNFAWEEADSDKDMVESVVDEKLIQPEIDVSDAPMRKLRSLFEGMMEAWNEGKKVKNAKEEMPLEGNR